MGTFEVILENLENNKYQNNVPFKIWVIVKRKIVYVI